MSGEKHPVRDFFWPIWPLILGMGWVEFYRMGARTGRRRWTWFGVLYQAIWLADLAILMCAEKDMLWSDLAVAVLALQWIPQLTQLCLCRKEYRAMCVSPQPETAVAAAPAPPAEDAGSALEPPAPPAKRGIIGRLIFIVWVGIASSVTILIMLGILRAGVYYFQGMARIEAGDYGSAWNDMNNASAAFSAAAVYREYCEGMQRHEAGDYEAARAAFARAGNILDAPGMEAECAALLETDPEAARAWELAGGPESDPEDRLWIKPAPCIDADSACRDYLFTAEPGSTVRLENAAGVLKNDLDSAVIPESGTAVLRIADDVFLPNRSLTERYYAVEPSFSVIRPDGTAYAVLCDPWLYRASELTAEITSALRFFNKQAGDTVRIEAIASSEYASAEVNGEPMPVFEGGRILYDMTLTEEDMASMQDGRLLKTLAFHVYQNNCVSADLDVQVELLDGTVGDGWRFASGALTLWTNSGMADFHKQSCVEPESWGMVKKIIVKKEVTRWGDYAYRDNANDFSWVYLLDKVAKIELENGNENLYIEDGVLYDRAAKTALRLSGPHAGQTLVVRAGTESVANYAFANCQTITRAELPDGLLNIGYSAFLNCERLAGVSFPASLQKIDGFAFYGCIGLTELILPTQLKEMGDNAFTDCDTLEQIFVPDSVIKLGWGAFSYCDSLQTCRLPNGIEHLEHTFASCKSLGEIDLPSNLTHIGFGTFGECISLENIDIPDSVAYIGPHAFFGCGSLTSLHIPKKVRFREPGGQKTPAIYGVFGSSALRVLIFEGSETEIINWVFAAGDEDDFEMEEMPVSGIGLTSIVFMKGPPREYDVEQFTCLPNLETIYYTAAYAKNWAPGGETEWNGILIMEIDEAGVEALIQKAEKSAQKG